MAFAGAGRVTARAIRTVLPIAALAVLIAGGARADAIYSWQTLSASLNGAPSDLTASGSIVLTDAAAARGSAAVISDTLGGTVTHSFDGIAAARFQMFTGPNYTISSTDPGPALFNVAVGVHGDFLDFTGGNQRYGGFAVDPSDSEAYFAVANGDIWTIGYGSDSPASPCFGSQRPGAAGNRCAITGVFTAATDVPEPASALTLLAGIAALALIGPSSVRG